MNVKNLTINSIAFAITICFLSCSMLNDNLEMIGDWKSENSESADLGAVKYVLTISENNLFEFQTHILETSEIMGFSGIFEFQKRTLTLNFQYGFGLINGEKIAKEEIDITEVYKVISLNTERLELKELSSGSILLLKKR